MYMGGRASAFALLLFLGGIGLAISCLRAILFREGSYDDKGGNPDAWSYLLGIALGTGMAVWGFSLLSMLGELW